MLRIKCSNPGSAVLWAAMTVMTLFMGPEVLIAQFRAPNIISRNVAAGSYCLGTDLFENLHIAYVTGNVLNLHTLLADGRVTDMLVATNASQPDLDFFSVSLHLAYLQKRDDDPGGEIWYAAQVGRTLRTPELVSPGGERCCRPAIEVDLRGNPFFAWERYDDRGETVIQLAGMRGEIAGLGRGERPDLVVDSGGNLHVFFLRDGIIHYTSDASSAQPRTFPEPEPIAGGIPAPHSSPRAMLAGGSNIYLAFSAGGGLQLANNITGNFEETRLIDTGNATSPSLDFDNTGSLALSYQKNGAIYYVSGNPEDPGLPVRIFSGEESNLAPMISTDTFGNHSVIFGQEDTLLMTTDALPPVAAFSITQLAGIAPLEVQMRDESAGDVTAWLWALGDGDSSVLQNPVHTYQEPGEYPVSLTVIGPGGRSVSTVEQVVQVNESGNRMWVADVRVYPGLEAVYIPVEVTHDVPVQAIQVAATFDPGFIEVTGVDFLLTNLRLLSPELLAFNISNNPKRPYVTSGIIFDIEPPYDGRTLPPGENQRLLNIIADISPLAPVEGSTVVRLANGVGEPPLENILTVNSMTVLPRLEKAGTVFFSAPEMSTAAFVRGDANGNQLVNISDPVVLLGYLFLGENPVACLDAADANDSGTINVADAAYSLNFLFRGGRIPPPPFPNPGLDPSEDTLNCDQ